MSQATHRQGLQDNAADTGQAHPQTGYDGRESCVPLVGYALHMLLCAARHDRALALLCLSTSNADWMLFSRGLPGIGPSRGGCRCWP